MARPTTGTYPAYYDKYISLVEADTIDEAVHKYSKEIMKFFRNIPVEKETFRYAADKWSMKEMVQHIIDTERVFSYRAMCIARKDTTPFPSFDENAYAANSKADARSWDDLLTELECTRQSTNLLLQSFDEEQLQQTGTASDQTNNVNAIAFTIFGHILHHINVVKERYL
jgi:uncharacterized damage-inducible protein DinB